MGQRMFNPILSDTLLTEKQAVAKAETSAQEDVPSDAVVFGIIVQDVIPPLPQSFAVPANEATSAPKVEKTLGKTSSEPPLKIGTEITIHANDTFEPIPDTSQRRDATVATANSVPKPISHGPVAAISQPLPFPDKRQTPAPAIFNSLASFARVNASPETLATASLGNDVVPPSPPISKLPLAANLTAQGKTYYADLLVHPNRKMLSNPQQYSLTPKANVVLKKLTSGNPIPPSATIEPKIPQGLYVSSGTSATQETIQTEVAPTRRLIEGKQISRPEPVAQNTIRAIQSDTLDVTQRKPLDETNQQNSILARNTTDKTAENNSYSSKQFSVGLTLLTANLPNGDVPDTSVFADRKMNFSTTEITTPLRSMAPSGQATAQQISVQLLQISQDPKRVERDILLNPQELGNVRLSLKSNEHTIHVSIVVERPETLELMRRHIDQLISEFRAIGYNEISFSFAQQNHAQDQSETADNHSNSTENEADIPQDIANQTHQVRLSNGQLDIRM